MKIIIILLVSLQLVGCGNMHELSIIDKQFQHSIFIKPDSIPIPYLSRNHRWYCANNSLITLDMLSNDYFCKISTLPNFSHTINCARIGHGPNEYNSPGLVHTADDKILGFYELEKNQIQFFTVCDDSLKLYSEYAFPISIKARNLPKPYSSTWLYNDTMLVAISFPPLIPEVDLIDIKNERIIASMKFHFPTNDKVGSYPYLFKADYCNGNLVIAYNYIDQIDLYKIKDQEFKYQYSIGKHNPQDDIFTRKADNDAVFYYQDIVCDSNHIYAIRQDEKETNLFQLGSKFSNIEIFDIVTGKGKLMINTGRFFERFTIDRENKTLYLVDPTTQDNVLYVICADRILI